MSSLKEYGLEGTSFSTSAPSVKHRLVLNVEGMEGTGKTHFALTSPGPIAYFNSDQGLEGVINQFPDKEILVAQYTLPSAVLDSEDLQLAADEARKVWKQMKADWYKALAAPKVRTLVSDTHTWAWELKRMAAFGKLLQVPSILYAQVNAEFSRLITDALDSDKNVIFIHRLREEWGKRIDKNGKEVSYKTGELERSGYREIAFEVQVSIRLSRSFPEMAFEAEVRKCRQNDSLTGLVLKGQNVTFPRLASMVFGNSTSDWK